MYNNEYPISSYYIILYTMFFYVFSMFSIPSPTPSRSSSRALSISQVQLPQLQHLTLGENFAELPKTLTLGRAERWIWRFPKMGGYPNSWMVLICIYIYRYRMENLKIK